MKKSILFSFMIIGAVAAMITAATSASFTDTVTSNGNTFKAGTLQISLDSKCDTVAATAAACDIGTVSFTDSANLAMTNMKPGDTIYHDFIVKNIGSLPVNTLTATATPDSGVLWTCGGTGNTVQVTTATPTTPLAVNGTQTIRVTVAMPIGANNSCQGQSGNLSVSFAAGQ